MSIEARALPIPLEDYVRGLVDRLAAGEPASYRRLRAVVGARRARLRLDDEVVELCFHDPVAGSLHVRACSDASADLPIGTTDSATVVELMRGTIELRDAILEGLVDARGSVDDVVAIAIAIEILIDAAARVPAMLELAREFHERHGGHAARPRAPAAPRTELDLLTRLDLIDPL